MIVRKAAIYFFKINMNECDRFNIIFSSFTIIKILLIFIVILLLICDNRDDSGFHFANPIKFVNIFIKELSIQSIEKLSVFTGMILFFKFRSFFINNFRGPLFSICFILNLALFCMLIFKTNPSFPLLHL